MHWFGQSERWFNMVACSLSYTGIWRTIWATMEWWFLKSLLSNYQIHSLSFSFYLRFLTINPFIPCLSPPDSIKTTNFLFQNHFVELSTCSTIDAYIRVIQLAIVHRLLRKTRSDTHVHSFYFSFYTIDSASIFIFMIVLSRLHEESTGKRK